MDRQRVELGRGWSLDLEVSKNQHADVSLVSILDVRALPDEWPTRPNPTGSIDCKVVADIRPTVVVHMTTANGPQSILGIPGTAAGERRGQAVMVHRYRPNGRHAVHPFVIREHGCPRCPCRYVGESRIDGRRWSDTRLRNHASIDRAHRRPVWPEVGRTPSHGRAGAQAGDQRPTREDRSSDPTENPTTLQITSRGGLIFISARSGHRVNLPWQGDENSQPRIDGTPHMGRPSDGRRSGVVTTRTESTLLRRRPGVGGSALSDLTIRSSTPVSSPLQYRTARGWVNLEAQPT